MPHSLLLMPDSMKSVLLRQAYFASVIALRLGSQPRSLQAPARLAGRSSATREAGSPSFAPCGPSATAWSPRSAPLRSCCGLGGSGVRTLAHINQRCKCILPNACLPVWRTSAAALQHAHTHSQDECDGSGSAPIAGDVESPQQAGGQPRRRFLALSLAAAQFAVRPTSAVAWVIPVRAMSYVLAASLRRSSNRCARVFVADSACLAQSAVRIAGAA